MVIDNQVHARLPQSKKCRFNVVMATAEFSLDNTK